MEFVSFHPLMGITGWTRGDSLTVKQKFSKLQNRFESGHCPTKFFKILDAWHNHGNPELTLSPFIYINFACKVCLWLLSGFFLKTLSVTWCGCDRINAKRMAARKDEHNFAPVAEWKRYQKYSEIVCMRKLLGVLLVQIQSGVQIKFIDIIRKCERPGVVPGISTTPKGAIWNS